MANTKPETTVGRAKEKHAKERAADYNTTIYLLSA